MSWGLTREADAGQEDECFRCPFFSHSPPASSSIRDCSCEQGIPPQPPRVLTQLPLPAGRYLYVNSSEASWGPQGSCDSCPAHAWSPIGSSSINQCQCIGGRACACWSRVSRVEDAQGSTWMRGPPAPSARQLSCRPSRAPRCSTACARQVDEPLDG